MVYNITGMPDAESINKMGGYDFSYPRLAFVDGAQDPWRMAGVHRRGLPPRKSTVSEPYILVDWGVHHWDEYGATNATEAEWQPDFPPKQVLEVQQMEIDFVKAWLDEFKEEKMKKETMQPVVDEDQEFLGEL